jgi:preflagellin peptidase FlaK
MELISVIRVGLSMIMLGYTSWIDIKTREIYDLVWVIFGGLGLAISIYELYINSFQLYDFLVPVAFAAAVSLVLGYLGLFGGADVLAFITLAILNPLPPRLLKPSLDIVSSIYPITLVSNSAMSGVAISIIILVRNLILILQGEQLFKYSRVSILKKTVIMFSGYRIDLEKVRGPPYHYPLEVPQEEDNELVFMPDIMDDDAAFEVFDELKKQGVTRTWVSYTLPFLLFITIGYVLSLLVGDIILYVITRAIF